MSNGIRRLAAVLILIAGAALLWLAGQHSNDAAAAKDDLDSTVAYAREHAASSDPRLKGAYSFERGGWYTFISRATRHHRLPAWLHARKEIQDAFPPSRPVWCAPRSAIGPSFARLPRNALAQN